MMSKRKRLPEFDLDALDGDLRLWFLALFWRDIGEAGTFAQQACDCAARGIDDRDPVGLYCVLHDAAVVRYARAFLGCKLPDGTGTTRLPQRYQRDHTLVVGTEAVPFDVVHNLLLRMRHGIVAHADMRERIVTLVKNHDNVGEPNPWTINTSGGTLTPVTMRFVAEACQQLKNRLVLELRPLVQGRVATMRIGEIFTLASDHGSLYWVPDSDFPSSQL